MSRKLNIIGRRFGRLIVIGEAESQIICGKPKRRSICQCDCGQTKIVANRHLLSGTITSCRCYQKERTSIISKTHGRTRTRIYRIWRDMLGRCYNPRRKCWKHYGGRGISVCPRWHKFENFFEDMGDAPIGLTLDRWPNNNGNYEPENCRWATLKQQSRNKRNTRWVTFNGKRLSLKDHCDQLGRSYYTTIQRITKLHWPVELALTKKIR